MGRLKSSRTYSSKVSAATSGLLFACTFLQLGIARAQDGAPIRVGESEIYTGAALTYFSDNNALRRNENTIDATGWLLAPRVSWKADKRATELSVEYEGEYQFSSEDRTEYNDHALVGIASTEFSRRSRGQVEASFRRTHEDLGTGFTRQNPEAFDSTVIDIATLSISHRFGADGARGNISSRLLLRSVSHANNDQLTNGSDRIIIRPSVTFSLRVAGNTRAFVSLGVDNIGFDDSSRDRLQTNGSVGLSWNEEGKTGGSLGIGSTRANFDSSERDDRTTLSVEGELFYLPVPFSRFELSLERSFEESTNPSLGSDLSLLALPERNKIELDWTHRWSSRLSHTVNLANVSFDVDCPADNRDTTTANVTGSLELRRWLTLSAGFAYTDQQSDCGVAGTDSSQEYDQSILLFSVSGSL